MKIKVSTLINPELDKLAVIIANFREENRAEYTFTIFDIEITLKKMDVERAEVYVQKFGPAPNLSLVMPSSAAVNLFMWLLRKNLI